MPFAPNASNTNLEPDEPKHNHSTSDAQQEHLSVVANQGTNIGGHPSGPLPNNPSYIPSIPSWVIERQRFLRAHGYNIRVDGIWGGRSQRAWQRYVLGQQVTDIQDSVQAQQAAAVRSVRDRQEERLNELRLHAQHAADQARKDQRYAEHLQRIEDAAHHASQHLHEVTNPRHLRLELRREHRRDAAVQRYDMLRASAEHGRTAVRIWGQVHRHPGSAPGLTTDQLAAMILDPSSPFDPTDERDTRAVQKWLNAHGEDVKEDGHFGEETEKALVHRFEIAREREMNAQRHRLADQFYKTGVLRAGADLPYWFPTAFGEFDKVPTPGELLKILQAGGSFSAVVWRSLTQQLARPDVQFEQFRLETFRHLAESLRPSGAALEFIGGRTAVQDMMVVLSSVYPGRPGSRTPVLAPDGTVIGYDVVAADPGYDEARPARARVAALLDSSTFEQYQDRLRYIEIFEEMEWRREQQRRAAAGNTWWVKALKPLGWLGKPGDWLRTELVAEGLWMYHDPAGYFRNAFDPTYTGNEDDKQLNYWKGIAKGEIEDLPWYVRYPFEIVVDPLIIAGPLAKGGVALSLGATALLGRTAVRVGAEQAARGSLYGLAIARAGRLTEVAADSRLGLPLAKARMTSILADPGINAGAGVELASSIYRGVKWATRMKTEAVAAATTKVQWAMRHGFRAPGVRLGERLVPEFKISSARTNELLDLTEEKVDTALPSMFSAALASMHAERASIWLDSARTIHSSFGASLRARMFEEFRHQEIERFATIQAHQVYRSVLDAAETEPFEGIGAVTKAQVFTDKLLVEARYAARKEYDRVRQAAGLYTKGTSDALIREQIDRQVFALMDKFDQVIFPAMQRRLEIMAEQAGFSLWDEAGLWLGRHGTLASVLKRFGLDTFDPANVVRVANPMFNQAVEADVASSLMEAEIRRRQARLLAYYTREVAGGNPNHLSEEWLERKLTEVEDEVRSAWVPVRVDGKTLMRDSRSHVEESAMYARHLDVSLDYEPPTGVDDLEGWLAHAAQIAVPNGVGQIDREIGEAAWALNGGFGSGPQMIGLADKTARRFPIPLRDVTRQESTTAFVHSVLERQVALGRAYDEVLGQAFYREGALFQALAFAQSKPLKGLYIFTKAQLALWMPAVLILRPAWHVRNIVDNTVKSFIAGVHDPSAYFLGAAEVGTLGKGAARVGSVFDVNLPALRGFARLQDSVFGTRAAEGIQGAMDTFWMHEAPVVRDVLERHAIPVPEEVLERMSMRPLELAKRPRLFAGDLDEVIRLGDDEAQRVYAEAVGNGMTKAQAFREAVKASDNELLRDAEKVIRLSADEIQAQMSTFEIWKDKIFSMMGGASEMYGRRVIYRDTYYKAIKAGATPTEAFEKAIAKVEHVLFDYSKISTLEDNLRPFMPFVQFWRKNFSFWLSESVSQPWVPAAVVRFEQERDAAHQDLPPWMRRYFSAKEAGDALARVPGLSWMAPYVSGLDVAYDPMNFFSFAPLYRSFKAENPSLPGDKQGIPFIAPFFDALSDWGLGLSPFIRKPLEHAGILNSRAWQSVFPQLAMAEGIARYFDSDVADWIHDFDAVLADPVWGSIDIFLKGDRPSDFVEQAFNQWVQMEMTNQLARGEEVDRAKAESKVRAFLLVQQAMGFFIGAYVRRMTPEDVYLYQLEDAVMSGDQDFRELSPEDQELYRLWRLRKVDRIQYDRYVEQLPLIRAYYSMPDYRSAQKFKQENPSIIPHVEPIWTNGRIASSAYIPNAMLAQDTELAIKLFDLADALDLSDETRRLAEQWLVTDALREFWARNDTAAQAREKFLRGLYYRHLFHLSDTFHALPETDYDAKESFLHEHPELVRFWNSNNSGSDNYKSILNAVLADLRRRYFEFADAGDWDGANAFLQSFPFLFDKFAGDDFVVDRTTGRPDAGGSGRMSQHARDYLAAKEWLDYYFSLPQAQRSAWLNSGAAGAQVVLAYFKKYSKGNAVTRSFGAVDPAIMGSRNPELNARLSFWQRYFALDPSRREAYVKNHAEEHGIFVYGILGAQERADKEAEWYRNAYRHGLSVKAAHYLYVAPLIDFFFTLKDKFDKQLFLKANPEVAAYFDRFSHESPTGDPALDALLERYFKLPQDSPQRSVFLKEHPEIQDFFDSKSTPAERAMHRLLEVYFSLEGKDRQRFAQRHPEISAYFEKRRQERDFENATLGAFDLVDPRLQPYYAFADRLVVDEGNRMRERLARGNDVGLDLQVRR